MAGLSVVLWARDKVVKRLYYIGGPWGRREKGDS